MKYFLSLIILLIPSSFSYAQSEFLDKNFGNKGIIDEKVSTPPSIVDDGGVSIIQPDGKIVIAGDIYDGTSNNKIILIRYNYDGSLDTNFGDKGKSTLTIAYQPFIRTIAIQKNGRILVAGGTTNKSTLAFDFLIVGYKPNGAIDSTFGINGVVQTEIKTGDFSYSYINSIVVLSDENILALGQNSSREKASVLIKYKDNGNIDSSFGSNGLTINSNSAYFNIAIQNDKKIIVSGDTAMVRILENGLIDSSFSNNGLRVDSLRFCRLALLQNEGYIFRVGYKSGNLLERYKNNGDLDSTFGLMGISKMNIDPKFTFFAGTIQANGKLLFGACSDSSFLLTRYQSNGIIDSAFGLNGSVETVFKVGGLHSLRSVTLEADGKIITSGFDYAGTYFHLVRYNGGEKSLLVSLNSFTLIKREKSIMLNWQTLSESNSEYFSIQRSEDGLNFSEIGKVYSKANSNSIRIYDFEDLSPVKGFNYYKLKQVDKDGHLTLSKTIFADFTNDADIKIYPNPAKDYIIITGLNYNDTVTKISIVNTTGVVLNVATTSNSRYNYNIQFLPYGHYFLKIDSNKKTKICKLVVAK